MKKTGVASWVIVCGGLLVGSLLTGGEARAETYRLAIEPVYPPEQAEEVYKPLIDYLNRTTGHRFELVLARNYHTYWRNLREKTAEDFAYDEAHFVDYRIQHLDFRPVARTSEPSVYALLAQPEFEGEDARALIGLPVACMPSPSLGFALLAEMYNNNPLAQPSVRSEASSWRDGVEMIFAGEVVAAMVPEHLAETYYNLSVIARTKPVPGRAFTAAPDVPQEAVDAFAKAVEALHEDPELYNVLAELGATRFVPATAEEYAGYEKILSRFYGYRKSVTVPPGASDIESDADSEPAT